MRNMMTGPMEFYIDALPSYPCPAPGGQCEFGIGDDSNDGLSPATPWGTFDHAIRVLQTEWDFAGQKPKLILMSASPGKVKYYQQHLIIPPFVGQEHGVLLNNCSSAVENFRIGSGYPALQVEASDPTNPIGVLIEPPPTPVGQAARAAVTVLPGASASFDGIAVATHLSNSDGFDMFGSGVIKRTLWGNAGTGGGVQIAVGPGAWVLFDGPGTITGGGHAWVSISAGGRFDVNSNGVGACAVDLTFTSPVHYHVGFAEAYDGGAGFLYTLNFINKHLVTGRRANIIGGAHVIVQGHGSPDPDYFPGDQPMNIDSKSSYR